MRFLHWFFTLLLDQRGQIPSSVTDAYDALLTTTLRAVQPRIRDNISRSNRWLAWLDSKGRFRKQNGGYNVRVPLMHAQNSTADIMSGYGVVDTTPQDGITSAFYDWSQIAVSISISEKEKMQNSGDSAAIDLLKAKTMQSEVSAKELLNNCLMAGKITSGASGTDGQFSARTGRMDSGATGPLPLAALIDYTIARSVSIGNINGSTYAFWRNAKKASSATTFAGLKLEMNNLYNTCTKGVGGNPDLMIGDQVSWETYWGALAVQDRYVNASDSVKDVLGGTDTLAFRGAQFIWDETVPDVATNAEVVDAVGTVTKSTIYYLNSGAFEWISHPSADFTTTPFVRPENQLATTAIIHWMGAMGVNNRRKNGVLGNISLTITS